MITIGTTCLYDVARGMIVLPWAGTFPLSR